MEDESKLYIEIVVSVYNVGGSLGKQITRDVLEGYLEVKEEKEELTQRLKRSYYRIAREEFKEINFESYKSELSKKIDSLDSILFALKPNEFIDYTIDRECNKKLNPAYEFYSEKTRSKRGNPIKLCRLKEPTLKKIEDLFIKVGKDSIELDILSEIKDYLVFKERYLPVEMDIKEVEKVAHACREIYESNNKIPREDIHEKVLSQYYILSYEDLEFDEYQKRVKKVSKQWVRDNEEKLNIW